MAGRWKGGRFSLDYFARLGFVGRVYHRFGKEISSSNVPGANSPHPLFFLVVGKRKRQHQRSPPTGWPSEREEIQPGPDSSNSWICWTEKYVEKPFHHRMFPGQTRPPLFFVGGKDGRSVGKRKRQYLRYPLTGWPSEGEEIQPGPGSSNSRICWTERFISSSVSGANSPQPFFFFFGRGGWERRGFGGKRKHLRLHSARFMRHSAIQRHRSSSGAPLCGTEEELCPRR